MATESWEPARAATTWIGTDDLAVHLSTRFGDVAEDPPTTKRTTARSVQIVLGILFLATCAVYWPLWPSLVLAVWAAIIARPIRVKLTRWTGGRTRASAVITALMIVVALGPLVALSVVLANDAIQLAQHVSQSGSGRGALLSIVSGPSAVVVDQGSPFTRVMQFVRENGERAWALASTLAGVTTSLALGAFVFFAATYFWLAEERRVIAWLEESIPMPVRYVRRFGNAFVETGRAIFIGFGVTGLTQAVLATIAFAALGVPRALALGMFVFFASFVPVIGTALVWVPVAAGLFLTGSTTKGIIMLAVGALVIAGIDNIVRPVSARWVKLDMHGFVLLLAMLGGAAAFGPSGLILGPILTRLTLEALRIVRDDRLATST